MKLMKSELKQVIRECLLEILQEGIGQIPQPRTVKLQTESSFVRPSQEHDRNSVAKDMALRQAIKREAGGNKMMEDIFSDTATNTLPSMLRGEKGAKIVPQGVAERIVEASEPADLFGEEVASKWASLAFAGDAVAKSRE